MSYHRLPLLVPVLAFALLSACGFQLRGSGEGADLPAAWRSMYLATGNPNGELSREVRAQFAANGINWADDRADAAYVVKLGPERFHRENLSINAEARAAEFELTLSTRFEVVDAAGNTVIDETQASVVQQMENDPRNVVGKAEEIRIIRGEMRTQLAQKVLRHIGFYAASTAP